MNQPESGQKSILDRLLKTAIEAGSDYIEVESEDGEEIVYAFKGNNGIGIASFDSDSPEAVQLLKDLSNREGKKMKVEIGGINYTLRVVAYDNFGEDAYRVRIRKV